MKLYQRIAAAAGSCKDRMKAGWNRLFSGSAESVLRDESGEAYIGEVVKILIAVVVGALLLSLVYALIKEDVFPELKNKIVNLFNYGETT